MSIYFDLMAVFLTIVIIGGCAMDRCTKNKVVIEYNNSGEIIKHFNADSAYFKRGYAYVESNNVEYCLHGNFSIQDQVR